jgi:exopolyphosphatase/guanosine-5'-triphosphate,3'-diphosphate pyrophosphatase
MLDKTVVPVNSLQARQGAPSETHHSRPGEVRPERRTSGSEAPAYAALDLGTNNCRLLVARPQMRATDEPASDGNAPDQPYRPTGQGVVFEVIDAFSRIVRLGEGVDRSGVLSRDAMDRTIDALKVCAAKIRRRRVVRARQVATEACRRASNCGEFIRRVRGETGLDVEIISSAEEAALALGGCATLLDPARPNALVFDIGGGSTELMWARLAPDHAGADLIGTISLPFGVINLSENFGGDCVSTAAFERMIELMRGPLETFEARYGIRDQIAAGRVQMLGTSGTVTTLAGVRLRLPCYDRAKVDGCYLDFAEMREVTRQLMALDCKARALEPCIGTARADLVIAGCAILEAICRIWPVGRLRVADRGVREGILANLMRQPAAIPAGR